ncbi:MAG TPA: hypothetical protein PLO24_08620 [Bacteroidales bacterium]|jgi:hypothetical protein|nr:hypothetical protein [Bacteroidales bacterium]HOS70914.1 hypothetical protein [Bacteroidales bacterium]HQH23539.1 hypothetical protein [Bacteroidales bacterium]HQJ81061.1 hypothetical protein [Bacteroidales bacterium]
MKRILFISALMLAMGINSSFSQNDSIRKEYAVRDTISEDIILFDSDELLDIELRFNITQYRRKRDKSEYLDATLTYHVSQDDSIIKYLKIRPRGISRLTICDFPPLLLNFKKNDAVPGEFNRVDKIKMVTHCSAGGEDNLLREFLVYKMYNVLTDYSFRVRLLRVNYVNSEKPDKKQVREFAFLIEPVKSLGKRTNSVEVETAHVTQLHIKREIMDRMAIFNYMIGNTDWSVPTRHNTLTMTEGSYGGLGSAIIVPYDFDYAGVVNTHYAVPFEGLGLESVRQRRYLGVCRTEQEFSEALVEFMEKKEEIYRVINDFPYLSGKSKKDMINYLEGFYRSLDKRNSIINSLRRDCIII